MFRLRLLEISTAVKRNPAACYPRLLSTTATLYSHSSFSHKTSKTSKMPKVIVGLMGSSVASGSSSLSTPQQVSAFLATVKSHPFVRELDTARVYNGGRSEELLGEVASAQHDFAISTKAPGWTPGVLSEPQIRANCAASLAALRQDIIDIYYIHGPDRTVPLEEQCRAMAGLYREGKFRRFGVSNLTSDEVRKIHEICTREGYVLPTVYQGGYCPLARQSEDNLFPTLRELGIAFYAFSPLAGGLLAKPVEQIMKPEKGTRFDMMPVFRSILTETVLDALKTLTETCRENGNIPIMQATLRWFMHHSPLGPEDGFVLGASKAEQIEASLAACEQPPLPDAVAQAFEEAWQKIKQDNKDMFS